MSRILQLLVGVLLIIQSPNLFSQITIGSGLPANQGTLLDLKESDGNSTRGLGLPRVALVNRSTLTIDDTDPETYIGALVYNVTRKDDNDVTESNRICPGIHVWHGDSWQPLIPYPQFVGLSGSAADDLVDIRNDGSEVLTYHTAYFRVFNENVENVRVNSCDPEDMSPTLMLDAGRWMTQNLRTFYLPNSTTRLPSSPTWSSTEEQLHRPNMYESRKMGNDLRDRTGLFYNWAAATNMKGGSGYFDNVDNPAKTDETIDEPKRRQGICPKGWHLPSQQEYLQLFEVVQLDPEAYTIDRNDGVTPLSPIFGILALKDNVYTGVAAGLRDTKGSSKSAEDGGFAFEMTGYARYWPNYYDNDWWPGGYGRMWTNSSSGRLYGEKLLQAWAIQASNNATNDQFVFNSKVELERDLQLTVRCKED